jgi:cell wall-associated NlpC family hydrolase
MSTLPRRLAIAAAVVAALAGLPATTASASRPDPTQRLHEAQASAAAAKERLAQTQAQVSAAQSQLTALAATAQRAVDEYTTALARLRAARATARAAQATLAATTADATARQRELDAFVKAAYMSGGPLTATASIVLSANGPADVVSRASMLSAVSQTQSDVLGQLVQARQEQSAAAGVAAAATEQVARTVGQADEARRTALNAVTGQHALVATLSSEQAELANDVAAHESQVAGIARAQAAAHARAELAAQRAELAASWSALEAAGEAMPLATWAQEQRAVDWAKRQLGVPYSWGGGNRRGPTTGMVNEEGNPAGLHTVGFDCSGLTLFAYAHAGFRLDHFTGYQWLEGHHIALELLRPGDLVFFAHNTANPMTIHHVGIYIGHGRMIDAPHTGAKVRYDDVFVPGLIGAVRP